MAGYCGHPIDDMFFSRVVDALRKVTLPKCRWGIDGDDQHTREMKKGEIYHVLLQVLKTQSITHHLSYLYPFQSLSFFHFSVFNPQSSFSCR